MEMVQQEQLLQLSELYEIEMECSRSNDYN